MRMVSACRWLGAAMGKQTVWMEVMNSSVPVPVDLTSSPVRVETSVSSMCICVTEHHTVMMPLTKAWTIVVRYIFICSNNNETGQCLPFYLEIFLQGALASLSLTATLAIECL